jgi:hypothetical protein
MITNQEILRKYGFKALPFKSSEQKSYFVKKKQTIINEMTILSNIFLLYIIITSDPLYTSNMTHFIVHDLIHNTILPKIVLCLTFYTI